jgi:hypothetical protein
MLLDEFLNFGRDIYQDKCMFFENVPYFLWNWVVIWMILSFVISFPTIEYTFIPL